MYQILLVPKQKKILPHVWTEGGEFTTFEAAEHHAIQTRKMKDRYKKVLTIPAPKPVEILQNKKLEVQIFERTFEANNMVKQSPEKIWMNDSFITSQYYKDYKFVLILKNGEKKSEMIYHTKELAVKAAQSLLAK